MLALQLVAVVAAGWVPYAAPYAPLMGVRVTPVPLSDVPPHATKVDSLTPPTTTIDVGAWLSAAGAKKRMVIFGTHAADFNAIEYGQRLRYYWPRRRLRSRGDDGDDETGVERCAIIFNASPVAAAALCRLLDVPLEDNDAIEVWSDPTGAAGRAFGVERGWLPDNRNVPPAVKLCGMLLGFGAWATLPAVISGYIGNPFQGQPWIEDALAVGMRQGRWPDTALVLAAADGSTVQRNKFAELPLVGSWPRRPLELATLRLQNMLGLSLAHWQDLAPDETALAAGVLTQLGGCLVVDGNGTSIYEWRDPGICAVANFEDIVKLL